MKKAHLPGHELPIYSEVKELALSAIKLGTENPRKFTSPEALKELASSIAQVGVIHPVTVYQKEKGGFEIIAGERRLRAAKLAKRETIPARELLNASPEIIAEIRLIENCQREGVSPLEEGAAFRDFGQPAEEIALRIGKSLRYVYDRLHLLALAPEPARLLSEGVLSLSQGLILCRLTLKEQEAIMPDVVYRSGEEVLGAISSQQLRQLAMRRSTVSLSQARFDTSDRRLLPEAGACKSCPKRSGANRKLFHDIEAGEICFDPECFHKKTHELCLSLERSLEEKGFEVVRLTGLMINTERAEKLGLRHDYDYNIHPLEEAEKQPKGQQKVAGVYFENNTNLKTGQAVAILPAGEEKTATEQEKGQPKDTRSKSALEEIKEQKARRAYKNNLLAGLGEAIGEHAGEELNKPTLRLLSLYAFSSMPQALQEQFVKFYKWQPLSENPEGAKAVFLKATAGSTRAECSEIMLASLIYSAILSEPQDKQELELVLSIAKEWGVKPEEIKKKVEQDFGVSLTDKP